MTEHIIRRVFGIFALVTMVAIGWFIGSHFDAIASVGVVVGVAAALSLVRAVFYLVIEPRLVSSEPPDHSKP